MSTHTHTKSLPSWSFHSLILLTPDRPLEAWPILMYEPRNFLMLPSSMLLVRFYSENKMRFVLWLYRCRKINLRYEYLTKTKTTQKHTLLFMTVQLSTTFRTFHMPDVVIITENTNRVKHMPTFSSRIHTEDTVK